MKAIAAILVAGLAVAFVAFAAKDIDALLERANELEAQGHKIVNEFHNHSKSHLLSAFEHELKNVERIAARLRNLSAEASNETRTHELNAIEEDLLHYENRLGEELDFVLEVYHYNATGKSANELINYAEALIKMAKDDLEKHAAHGHRETLLLQVEIREIELLVKTLKNHEHGVIHELTEATLVRHELTLRALLQRIAQHHN